MPTLVEMQEQLAVKSAELDVLVVKSDPTDADADAATAASAEIDRLQGEIKTVNDRRTAFAGLKTKNDEIKAFLNDPVTKPPHSGEPGTKSRTDTGESEQEKFLKRGPFKGLGHLAYAIKACGAERPGFVQDGILGVWNRGVIKYDDHVKSLSKEVKTASGLNELSDAEGSVTLPVEIAAGIWQRTAGEDNLLTRIGPTPVAGNGIKVRAWNDASRSGDVLFGGARAYWGTEAGQMTKSNPTFRDIDLRLNKLYVLMYATDELLEDAPAMESELTKVASACFVYKINRSLIRGGGVGEPQGLTNSPARVTQGAVSGQGVNTITATNIDQMWARRSPGSGANMIWLYQIDAEQQLGALSYPTGTNSGQLVNMPPTGLSGKPYMTLKGRDPVECEHCSALGTEGDIILWDPTQHIAIVKSNGINQSASMHLRFDFDETAFKFTFRMDARSRWETAMMPAQSTNKRSPIVTLNSSRT